jgi:transcription antitermination factor NusG
MAAGSKKWYVIRAISGKEKKVKEMVEMEVSRSTMGTHI